MKRPLLLPLAIALALSGTNALALGLGTIHVNSKLNQPLDAEIPVLQGTPGEAEGLLVQLAAAEDFDRVGLNRSRLSVPLEFSLVKNAHGEMVIKVTSKDVVREPFLDFLVEANWPKGRLLREYTVLLDPPVMAPATGATAVTSAAKPAPAPAATQPLPEAKPKAPPKSAPTVAAAPRAEKPSKPAPSTAPAPASAPKHAAASGEYTVQEGDTLSGIAREVRPDETTNINQLMLAMLKQNPNAFYKDNINALKRGAILRIPSADQVKLVGSASEAAAQVHAQIEDWRGGAAAKPTLVADTGAKPEAKATVPAPKTPAPPKSASTTTASKAGNERLELVPPKAGKDSIAMADRPGSGAGSASANAELKSELARTKEALTSRDQEATELKSRVKDLEETNGKSERLITIQKSEIADLQAKLKALQDQEAKGGTKPAATTSTTPATTPSSATATPSTSTTTPATTASTTPSSAGGAAPKVSKEDIWGNNAAGSAENKATTSSATPTAGTSPSATTSTAGAGGATGASSGGTTASTTPSTPTSPSSAASNATPTPGPTTPSSVSSTSASTPSTTSSTSSTTGTTTPSTTGSTASSTPSSATPSTTPSTTPTPAKPATTTAVKPTASTKVAPLASSAPAWYEQAWVKPAAIGAGALLLLFGLLNMRKRKAEAVATPRGSIAGAFGDSPIRERGAAADPTESEELALRDQLAHDPENLGLHLELLSLLYAERNVTAFEDAAEIMHAHVADPHQPEWLEVKAMGQELAPHNALFVDATPAEEHVFDDEAVTAPHAMPAFDHDDVFKPREDEAPATRANSAFDFDLGGHDLPAAPATTAAQSEAAFNFDHLPPVDFAAEAHHEAEVLAPPAPLTVDEDEFAVEDGVGTKLDLAKAYLDMGDPEGARSMLEEVLAEGNDSQKGEARRLMADIR